MKNIHLFEKLKMVQPHKETHYQSFKRIKAAHLQQP